MTSEHPPHNLELLRTWHLRLGHFVYMRASVHGGGVGVLSQGQVIALPRLEGTRPEPCPIIIGCASSSESTPIPSTHFCGSGTGGPNRNIEPEKTVSSVDACEDHRDTMHGPYASGTVDDRCTCTHVDALLSYLAFDGHVTDIVDDMGLDPANHGGIWRDDVVVITQVHTVDIGTLDGILSLPLADRMRLSRVLFEESRKGSFHCSSIPAQGQDREVDSGRNTRRGAEAASDDSASEVTLFVDPTSTSFVASGKHYELPSVDDTKPGPQKADDTQVMGFSAFNPRRDHSLMFIHYARAMERPSVWRRGLELWYWAIDAASYIGKVAEYLFVKAGRVLLGRPGDRPFPTMVKDDSFPLDELLKYMLAVAPKADIAVASTMELLEIFEDEDEMPVEPSRLRAALGRIRPAVITKERRVSPNWTRQVALLSLGPR